jgi:hypothetical protein
MERWATSQPVVVRADAADARRRGCWMDLVKHSVPTYARWNLQVDPSLHPALTRLLHDTAFRTREAAKLEPLCKANGLLT